MKRLNFAGETHELKPIGTDAQASEHEPVVSVPSWIRVEDEWPAEDDHVLCWFEAGGLNNIAICYHDETDDDWYEVMGDDAQYEKCVMRRVKGGPIYEENIGN